MVTSEIAERFQRTCRSRASTPAVIRLSGEPGVVSFAELEDGFRTVRRALVTLGVGAGSCVVSLVGNKALFFPIVVACLDVGASLMPLGEATDAEATALIARTGAAAVIADRSLPLTITGEVALSRDVRAVRTADTESDLPTRQSVVFRLTSGSTDLPKAAVATERHLIADGEHMIEAMGIGPLDVSLAMIPLSHAYALGNVVMPLVLQGTSVALRASFSPPQFLREAESSGATVFPGVPFMFDHLRASLDSGKLPDRLRLLITAGARIDPGVVAWFRERARRKIHSLYGTSETGGISYDDSDALAEPMHVGRPMPGTTVEIRPHPGVHEAGRVYVRGDAVSTCYADGRDAGAMAAFEDGGFLTGDLGSLDAEGRLVLSGRISPLVHVSGRKVDPAEVERTLVGLPGVTDARVLGVDCDKRGQELVAFIVRGNAALAPIAIRQLCAGTLSPHKIPRRFIFLDRLPVDARGKVDRRSLEALAIDELGHS